MRQKLFDLLSFAFLGSIIGVGTAIAVAGIDIVSSVEIGRRDLMIIAVSLALGLGVVYVPEIFTNKPALFQNVFSSATATGGLSAVLLNWLLPRNMDNHQ